MNYSELVQAHTRSEDNYVNATKWCAAFDKRWNDFKSLPTTKALLKAASRELPDNLVISRGRSGTWIHPVISIALAEWLSPEFSVYVKQTFVRFLEGDITLADDILQRSTADEAAWLEKRARGRVIRAKFTEELKKRGVKGWQGYAQNTNAIYLGLFGDTAAGLKESLGVKNPRDGMSETELLAVAFAESLSVDIMDKRRAFGNAQTTRCSAIAGNHVGNALELALDNTLDEEIY